MILLLTIFIVGVSCNPYRRPIIIPDLDVSPPEEINKLSLNKFQSRSLNVETKQNNFEDTIKEVEAILKTNPALPRLTRGEILDLLDNITQTDLQKANLYKDARDPKSIMVVMPFTPTNDNNMQDLYTKQPVTQIIGDNNKPIPNQTNKPVLPIQTNFKRRPSSFTTSQSTSTVSTTPKPTRRVPTKKQYPPKKLRPKQETSTQISIKTTSEYTTATSTRATPHYFSTTARITPEYSPTTTRTREFTPKSSTNFKQKQRGPPLRRRRPTITTTQHPNHRYPDEEPQQQQQQQYDFNKFVPSTGMTVIQAPKLSSSSEDLILQEDIRKDQVYSSESKLPHKFVTQPPEKTKVPNDQVYFATRSPSYVDDSFNGFQSFSLQTTTKEPQQFEIITAAPTIEDLNIPPHLTNVVKDMHLSEAMSGDIPTIKPMPDFKVPDDTEKIKAMLESLGIQTPTTTQMPNAQSVADNLSPDMKELLMSFGLLPDPNKKPDVKVAEPNPEKAEVRPDSFIGFKPLPEDTSSRSEMEELLASFGLGRSARKEKSLKKPPKVDDTVLSLEAVPDEYKGLLNELGLRQGKKIRSDSNSKNLNKDMVEKQHVFNPTDSQYATEEELEKLGKLIEMIKELEKLNRTITEEDLKKIDLATLKELVSNLKPELVPLNEKNNGPNPLLFDFGLSKNEVKRQENATTTTTTTTTTIQPLEIVTTSSTTIEESRNPSIKDLEDSFGGSSTVSTTVAPETTTQAKRTGFYYLLDWNTFLDIDDQKGKRVNLRLQPTVGDPKRFYSVTVP